jgi:SAM-dependent methyltransferase
MNNLRLRKTRDVVEYTARFIKGETLDLGAGNAKYRHIIKPKTSKYVTFDMFPGPHIDVVGDILNLSFPDKSFDTVVSTQVLEHVEKPWVMISEIARVIRPGGICILSAPFIVPYHADPNDFFRYTKNGLTSLFLNEGFEIVECESYGRLFSVFSEFFHFSFANPYDKKQNKIMKKLYSIIEKISYVLDKFIANKIIYPNSYIVARKK